MSEKIIKCCTDFLAERRLCFFVLEFDEGYVFKEFKVEIFIFYVDICIFFEDEK